MQLVDVGMSLKIITRIGIFKVYRQIWKLKKDKYIME